MNKLIIVYGAIAGLVIIVINTLSLEMGVGYAWLGFLVMFIAFSSIFVAVKQYRDETLGGVLRFGTGIRLGLGITVVASVVYVLVWELYLALTNYAFIDSYFASVLESRQSAGATDSELAAAVRETDAVRQQYSNPLYRLPISFIEIFPVGVLVSLVAAFVLRDNNTLASAQAGRQ